MKRIRNLLFGVGVLGALGFGAAATLATPAQADTRGICPFQRTEDGCQQCCLSSFGTYDYEYNPDTGECYCYF